MCRRCLVLYPLAYVIGYLAWMGPLDASVRWVPVAMMLLPLPTVIEWCGEHVANWTYSPARQVALTVPAAVALGYGLARYMRVPGDQWFWVMVMTWGGVCLAAQAAGTPVPGSVTGPGHPAELDGIVEEGMAGHHPDREPASSSPVQQ